MVAFAVALTQIAALTTRRRDDDASPVRLAYTAAASLAVLLALLVTVAIWSEVDSAGFFRLLAALAVLDVLLVVLQPSLRRLEPGAAARTTRVILEGTPAEIEEALARIESTGVRVRR